MPPWESFLDRLHRAAELHPARPALVESGGRTLSYSDLLGQVRRLAAVLRRHGIGRGSVLALGLGRSVEHVLGMLAAWRLGAAFLPLDRRWPDDRLDFILGDSDVDRVLTWPDQAERFRRLGASTFHPTESATDRLSPVELTEGDLAYVIYTSGSTGRPKGVAVEHRGLVNLLDAQVTAFDLASDSRSLWLLEPAFDASISDIGTALLSGASLHVEGDDALRDPASLLRLLHLARITHLDLPPALLGVLEPEEMPETMRALIVGGEPSPPGLLRRWARRVRLVNVYGPTEATVCTSLCVCDPGAWDAPLLGQPLPGVTYQVLDADLAPAPPGETGELCISGACLARGYVNLPDLTAAKFVLHQGERLYRTGDRVLRRADGEYVFRGRIDRQVKVRGQLVAPEEVEARLREHPAIRGAAVVKRPLGPPPAAEGLVAFVVARGPAPDPGALREFLGQRLPSWMAPQRMVVLEELPRTPGEKVDFARLVEQPLPRLPTRQAEEESDATILADIWTRLLGLPADPDGGFLEQGGDSLTLLQAVAAAHARGLNVPPALLAEDWSINAIASWLRSRSSDPGAMSCDELRADVESILAGPVHHPDGGVACVPRGRGAGRARLPPSRGAGSQGKEALPGATSGSAGASPSPWTRMGDPHTQPGKGPSRSAAGGEREAILLTGATGFLGSHLLVELLRRTRAEVFCLVRAGDRESGRGRLLSALRTRPEAIDLGRVHVLPGDLARPRFGLAAESWERLSLRIDSVYHCAARVNMVLPYAELRRDNVLAAAEVLRFARSGREKALHHASTLSVFVASDANTGLLLESDHLETTRRVHGGYAQSKWAAEVLLRRGAGGAAHYRFGLLTGEGRTGKGAANDFLTLFLRGLARLRCLPPLDRSGLFLDVTPIDFAAPAMAHLSLQVTGRGATFHLANSHGLSLLQIVEALAQRGVHCEEVGPVRWRERLTELESASPSAAAACLALCRGLEPGAFRDHRTLDLFQATDVAFDRREALAGLAGTGVVCPPPSLDLVTRYVTAALG
jgi:amino acid adenylation domain-containing protein/thioester reductase-like protein